MGADIALLIAIGLLMSFLGPFDMERTPFALRYLYWLLCIVGGGMIGIAVEEAMRRSVPRTWPRVVAASLASTPAVTLLVLVVQWALMGERFGWSGFLNLSWQVWPILIAVMSVRALIWRRLPARVETRLVVAPPLPEAEAMFRRRLSAKRRGARLIAVEAHDHYLRVHTDAGVEMITLRFADALVELSRAHGWRVHRSWWISADAIETVRWSRGGGEARLAGGLSVPVSRTHGPVLKEAGWF